MSPERYTSGSRDLVLTTSLTCRSVRVYKHSTSLTNDFQFACFDDAPVLLTLIRSDLSFNALHIELLLWQQRTFLSDLRFLNVFVNELIVVSRRRLLEPVERV